ncbi:hypothetical protein Q8F55_005936 [Vanrija albida]|uniref:F-box domain-containing protein n=1 Tax=Vanrija albida TaxID=181172 RepID=A0ABR3Q2Z5_9TREE
MSASNYYLPPEILADVISYLDPTVDRPTLHSLLCVSSTVNAIALPLLYERLTLNESQLISLVAGACDPQGRLSTSSSNRLGLVQHLALCPPPTPDTMAPVYAAMDGSDGRLLFPSVRTLRIDDPDHWKRDDFVYRAVRKNTWGGPPGLPPRELALFDSPDVCIGGEMYAMDTLEYLPSLSIKNSSLTVHTGDIGAVGGKTSLIQRGWRRLVVYNTESEMLVWTQAPFILLTNPAQGYAQEVMVYVGRHDKNEAHVRERLEADKNYYPYWDPSLAECLLFDDDPPPCHICGRDCKGFWDEADVHEAAEQAAAAAKELGCSEDAATRFLAEDPVNS